MSVDHLSESHKMSICDAWSTMSSSSSGRGCKRKKLTNHSPM